MSCPLCDYPNVDELETEIASGYPKRVVANDLECTVEEVQIHMEQHSKFADDPDLHTHKPTVSVQRRSYEKYDILEEDLHRLVDRFDIKMEQDRLTRDDTKELIEMHREIRQTIGTLHDLQKEMHQELKLKEEQFDKLKKAILRELNPDQQKIIIASLDEVELEASR